MIIGHLAAGYVASRLLLLSFPSVGPRTGVFTSACVLGAIAPDLDMIYFHLVDLRQHHHHTYVTHYPIVWIKLLLISFVWHCYGGKRKYSIIALGFSLNGFIHMFLDSIVGDVWWFAPFVDQPYAMFTVPALYQPWWLNFILHWSFTLELAMWWWAVMLWRKSRNPLFSPDET